MTTAGETAQNARPDGPRVARAALTRLVEPGDDLALATVAALGPERALTLLTGAARIEAAERDLLADRLGQDAFARRWSAGLARWAPRSARLDPVRDLVALHRLGGGLLIPEDPAWPAGLDDLGDAAPVGLWFRGRGTLPPLPRALAVVGSREATAYGRQVTRDVVACASAAGVCIVSGGAYGIDGAAHEAALETAAAAGRRSGPGSHDDAAPGVPPTVAVLAGGLDRFYPAGHERLLRAVMEEGLLLSEMPPGATPTRYRFLHRNRLIAALSGAVVVVEARWRSGAQNTAGHAHGLGREVGAVPGPVTSPSSAGCHRLLQEGPTRLIADPAQALTLLEPPRPGEPPAASPATTTRGEASRSPGRPTDGLTVEELLVHEALPLRRAVPVDNLTSSAGLALPTVLAVLTRLEGRRLAERRGDLWRRAPE
ncbi:DNA-protecting protein DprA [Micrococcus porci]|uniref:DNA-processing protein DprA n=1 Tax=Micrococcus TaxID=1269 RepID=UPI001CCE902D|nr:MULTISPECIES: DNA-processing protein DprA [Micrococcus]MCG7422369.1 DNA-protecting protein DprA [Micrococcus sp. ACRRV]UBH24141.1 DNA-protecting protein DprA [Micrococcus porci]